ncbi:DNA-binding transcriptional regulator, ArsR family [Variovorax sp. OK605]|uniref:ArsR/SmtB family transcription factor n=1 Tax=Variovorax sp. OK605 TaxID=1855317 RepID=UPI0008F3AEF8|nr:helix-turn-helix transcriptional regulator [Variovorax sp. OK605]SFO88994.1 DNA-binding transcriptional regulator, ArsR family [Variovorax sp. OK605]
MVRELDHPPAEQIGLSGIYDALSDPVRREMVLALAEMGEQNCSSFLGLGSKTNLSYHFARLRGSGLTLTRMEGTSRYMQLRRDDLAARFPGLLDAVVAAAREEKRVKTEAVMPVAAAKKRPAAAKKPAAKKPAAKKAARRA